MSNVEEMSVLPLFLSPTRKNARIESFPKQKKRQRISVLSSPPPLSEGRKGASV